MCVVNTGLLGWVREGPRDRDRFVGRGGKIVGADRSGVAFLARPGIDGQAARLGVVLALDQLAVRSTPRQQRLHLVADEPPAPVYAEPERDHRMKVRPDDGDRGIGIQRGSEARLVAGGRHGFGPLIDQAAQAPLKRLRGQAPQVLWHRFQ
jgi:hypothetical protein